MNPAALSTLFWITYSEFKEMSISNNKQNSSNMNYFNRIGFLLLTHTHKYNTNFCGLI